ncbi:hypothetical protein AOQ84DRAFT_300154 [Glonium stellatum]|uniref:Uncharacterized protein n=1 Tax=Glonium stellatum TaxID=574774 RepID=A0A8E2ETU5_9PEZI|nr:hypothetical protein AOQ84DRAFT_300154 [Glonium stellatum]
MNNSAYARIILKRNIPHTHIPKRPKSTSTTTTTTTPIPPPTPTPKTIPGPSWLWLEPFSTPFRAYGRAQQRRPYVTQFFSTLIIYLLGDLSAQRISPSYISTTTNIVSEHNNTMESSIEYEGKQHYDPSRTMRALLIGGISSIPSYRWFIWLGESFNYNSKLLSLTTKVLVNQIVFTPIFNSYFFGMQSALTGASGTEVVERIRHTVPVSWMNSCKIWPAVTAFSFTFVPVQFRSIFAGVIAIGWQTYLSLLNQRAAKAEAGEGDNRIPMNHTNGTCATV